MDLFILIISNIFFSSIYETKFGHSSFTPYYPTNNQSFRLKLQKLFIRTEARSRLPQTSLTHHHIPSFFRKRRKRKLSWNNDPKLYIECTLCPWHSVATRRYGTSV